MTEPLQRLLHAMAAERDDAWSAFLQRYTDLILFSIRKTEDDPDLVGDAYAYVVEQLRRDDCRRLRAFDADGPASFTTWLVVVVRRLAIDHHRRRNGRPSARDGVADPRRGLQELASAVAEIDDLPDESTPDAQAAVESAEVREGLAVAVSDLDPRDRLLLALRFEDGHSARVIAASMSYPSEFHVYRRLRRVLDSLRAALEAEGIGSPRG